METILLTPPENWPAFARFMSIRAFCRYSGVDYQTFRKMVVKNNFPMPRLGNFKLIDVELALEMVRREVGSNQE